MNTISLVLAALLLAAAVPAGAQSGTQPGPAGRVLDLEVESAALGRPLPFLAYLPEGHGVAGRRFPVVYLLHGYGADRRQWRDDGRIAELLDRLIAERRMPAAIAVMPQAGNSWYVDSGAYGGPGDYETAIAVDLVAAVDARFATKPAREARAVAGLSMGGFGALRLAFRHPGTFGVVAAMSPAIWKPGALSWSHGPAAMAPEAAAAKFLRTTGAGFDATVFATQVPFAEVTRVAALPEPPAIMLTVGDDDYFAHYDGALEMFLDLRAAGMKPELRVGDGGHDWSHWRPMAAEVMDFLGQEWTSAPGN